MTMTMDPLSRPPGLLVDNEANSNGEHPRILETDAPETDRQLSRNTSCVRISTHFAK